MAAEITSTRRPTPYRRYVIVGLAVALATIALLNWQTFLSVLVVLGVGLAILLVASLALLRLVIGPTGPGGKAVLAGIVGFVLGRSTRRPS